MHKTKDEILKSYLFGNKYITCRGTPIYISSFSKSNIKTVKQIWNSEANVFYEPELICDRFVDKTGWNANYKKNKSSFSSNVIEILKCPNVPSENTKGITIDSEVNIFFNNKPLEPRKFKLKIIQNILFDTDFKRKYMMKWKTFYSQSFHLLVSEKKQFQWKVIHNAIFTEHELFLMNMSNGLNKIKFDNRQFSAQQIIDCILLKVRTAVSFFG